MLAESAAAASGHKPVGSDGWIWSGRRTTCATFFPLYGRADRRFCGQDLTPSSFAFRFLGRWLLQAVTRRGLAAGSYCLKSRLPFQRDDAACSSALFTSELLQIRSLKVRRRGLQRPQG